MKNEPGHINDGPWALLGMAVFMFGGGWYMHHTLTAMEHAGGTMHINWIIAGIYNNFGKWGVVNCCLVLGAYMLFLSIRKFSKA